MEEAIGKEISDYLLKLLIKSNIIKLKKTLKDKS